MSNTHVISGLVKKRGKLAGEIEQMRKEMIQLKGELATVDGAILIFDPEYDLKSIKAKRKRTANKFFESGERSRAILDTLREAPEQGLSVRDIAQAHCTENGLTLQEKDMAKFVATIHDGVRQLHGKNDIRVVSRANSVPKYVIN